ncbi:integral membrane protein 2B-like [Centroberyx affinis]|uniref:integral membrane protein 2B-like n=1 Tax=Centroberyx affinis TaxID=166261 RepID=UPI003A5C6C06
MTIQPLASMVKITHNSALAQKEPNKPGTDEALIPEHTDQDVEGGQQARWRLSRCRCVCMGITLMLLGLVVSGAILFIFQITRASFCGVGDPEDYTLGQVQESIRVLEEEGVELINVLVPEFSDSDPADIVHDFNKNLTAYLDLTLDRCYITPLNTSIVLPPRDLQELLINMKARPYLPQPHLVREQMMVTGEVVNMGDLGDFINSLCYGRYTYMLERRAHDFDIQKHEALNCRKIRHFENTFVVETQICEP